MNNRTSTRWIGLALLLVLLAAGCGEAPAPTGPAADATTPDIEISIPDDAL